MAIGWLAVTEFWLSDGKTNMGVSLAGRGGRLLTSAGGASACICCRPSGWAFKACTGAPKAGSNGADAIACSTALRAWSTGIGIGSGLPVKPAGGLMACPWVKLSAEASGALPTGVLPNSEVLAPAWASGSIGTKSYGAAQSGWLGEPD